MLNMDWSPLYWSPPKAWWTSLTGLVHWDIRHPTLFMLNIPIRVGHKNQMKRLLWLWFTINCKYTWNSLNLLGIQGTRYRIFPWRLRYPGTSSPVLWISVMAAVSPIGLIFIGWIASWRSSWKTGNPGSICMNCLGRRDLPVKRPSSTHLKKKKG